MSHLNFLFSDWLILRGEHHRREARRENFTLPTIHLGPAGRRPALGLVTVKDDKLILTFSKAGFDKVSSSVSPLFLKSWWCDVEDDGVGEVDGEDEHDDSGGEVDDQLEGWERLGWGRTWTMSRTLYVGNRIPTSSNICCNSCKSETNGNKMWRRFCSEIGDKSTFPCLAQPTHR